MGWRGSGKRRVDSPGGNGGVHSLSQDDDEEEQQQHQAALEAQMAGAMRDAMQEVMAQHRAAKAQHSNIGYDAHGTASSEEPGPRSSRVTGMLDHQQQEELEDELEVPNNSPWARRALGDAWYEARCVRCCVCKRAINATQRAKRGQRCVGCLRWFHDACAPPSTVPRDKALREADPTTSSYFHCQACADVHERLRAGASTRCSQAGPEDGCSVVLLDLHALRKAASSARVQPTVHTPDAQVDTRQRRAGGSDMPFQRIARAELDAMKRLGEAPPAARVGAVQERDGGLAAHGGSLPQAGQLAGLKAVVHIFNTFDRSVTREHVLEDGWAALLRCGGRPVSAATVLVMGDDHARLQALVTHPEARRQGRARALVEEVAAWLGTAGVPRLVAVLPELAPGRRARGDDDGEGALRRLRLKPLQDLELLGAWKDVWFPYYTRELIGRGPRVLIRELKPAGSSAGQAHGFWATRLNR